MLYASLKDARNFTRVFKQGKSIRGSMFRVHYLRNEENVSRIGIMITHRAGSAVSRNLMRRRIKHLIRITEANLIFNYDLVLYINSPVSRISFEKLEKEIDSFLGCLEGGKRT